MGIRCWDMVRRRQGSNPVRTAVPRRLPRIDFCTFTSTYMPLMKLGSLTKPQYRDILTYVLDVSGYLAGLHELTDNEEERQATKFEPRH